MENPRVTIIMATHNRPVMLRRAIESVLKQNFSAWELVIIDNESTDETPAVLKEFAARDPRIILRRNERGLFISQSLEIGLSLARGEYIAHLDDDDYWIDDGKLKKQIDFLDIHPEYVLVGSGVVVVDGEGNERFRYFKKETDEEIRKTALFANPFSHTTVMFRTAEARKVGGYGSERYCEDWDLWLRLGRVGEFYNFQEYFTAYTMDGNNNSFLAQRPHTWKALQIIRAHRSEYPDFWKAYLLNYAQYAYSFVPRFMRRSLQGSLSSWKRRSF